MGPLVAELPSRTDTSKTEEAEKSPLQNLELLAPMNQNLKPLLSSKGNSSESQSCNSEKDVKPMYHFNDGIDLLSIKAVDPSKDALNLRSALFTNEELGSSCYKKRPGSKSEKPPLSPSRIALIGRMHRKEVWEGYSQQRSCNIQKKCNQKCFDTKPKVTKE
ncbi:hypothetical protein EMCRGX_G024506 [Ephydatia muelleri]